MNQVIFIGILNFNSFDGANYLTRHLILNKETLKQELQDLEFNFIELKKFTKQEAELQSIIEKWVYFIKNAGDLTMIPKSAEEIPELKEAYTQASMNSWSQGELEVYEYWQIRDTAERYSLEQQYDTGKMEGKIEGKFETAVEMIKDGESNDKISRYTGLTDSEIDGLRG